MNLKQIETYIANNLATVEQDVKDAFAKVVEFATGEEAKIKAEIEHLTGHGYSVMPPAEPGPGVTTEPQP